MRLSDWIDGKLQANNLSQANFGAAAGISKGTISTGVNHNEWSSRTIGLLTDHARKLHWIAADQNLNTYEVKLVRDRRVSRAMAGFAKGIEALKKAPRSQRDEFLCAALDRISERCNAYLVITCFGLLPRLFEKSRDHDHLRSAMYGAMGRRMMTFFVTPNEEFIEETRADVGKMAVPSIRAFREGYDRFRAGFLGHCQTNGITDAEAVVDLRLGMVEHDRFSLTSVGYISCYAGINPMGSGVGLSWIIERGPINENFLTVQPRHSPSENNMRHYLCRVLKKTPGQMNADFHENLAERMQLRTD